MRFEEANRTKQEIFDQSILLIASRGYKSVTMRDIAHVVGIQASSIYNHYTGKDQILEKIYEYYETHMFDHQPPDKVMKHIMRTGTSGEIVEGLTRMWVSLQRGQAPKLMQITKIIYVNAFSDDRATALFLKRFRSSTEYLIDMLNFGVKLGRLMPFDTRNFAFAFMSQYIVKNVLAFMGSQELAEQYSVENINAWMESSLPLK